jgi:hypothetical protein
MSLDGLKVRCDFCDDTVMLSPAQSWADWMDELHNTRRWRSRWKTGRWLNACFECRDQLPLMKSERERQYGRSFP